jgi:peptidoglycan/xylan/chitin deacetylase (PgdA/CDA1 family)
LQDGHAIGNHGYAHLNGWKTENDMYVKDFERGEKILKQVKDDYVQVQDSKKISRFTRNDGEVFRPAYGKLNYYK